jgi:hypothetical protein
MITLSPHFEGCRDLLYKSDRFPVFSRGRRISADDEQWLFVASLIEQKVSESYSRGHLRAVRTNAGWVFDDPLAPEAPGDLRASLRRTGMKEYFYLSDEDASEFAAEIRRVVTR